MKKILIYVLAVVVVIALAAAFISFKNSNTEVNSTASTTVTNTVSNEKATVSVNIVTAAPSLASVGSNSAKTIEWTSANYPKNAGVDINLIRKTSNSPVSYKFVRKIATNTANDGSENWVPAANETGDDLYIEVTCTSGNTFNGGCQISSSPVKAY